MNRHCVLVLLALGYCAQPWAAPAPAHTNSQLPKILISADGHGFVTAKGKPFVPFGLTYFRSGTGWAPQVWKKFDVEATRRDFVRMKELGVNCVRVFLSYGSFYQEPGKLEPEGLAKFDQFLKPGGRAGDLCPSNWPRPLGRLARMGRGRSYGGREGARRDGDLLAPVRRQV